jgi:hypothetical protein
MPLDHVNNAGAVRKAHNALNSIYEAIQSASVAAGEAMLSAAAASAPSIDEEYDELNAESGAQPEVARDGDRSADTDERIRFMKPEKTYIANAILDPANIRASGTLIAVGNHAFLNQQAQFSYQNWSKKRGSQQYTVSGYFDMFESGTAAITLLNIQPHAPGYPLRPGEGEDGTRSSVTKSIQGRWMFAPSAMKLASKVVLSAALASIGPGREGP